MKKRLIAIFIYAIFLLLFFITARIVFLVSHYGEASQFTMSSLVATFCHGMKLDLSAIGYIFMIPMLLIIPGVCFKGNWYKQFIKWYTYVIIVISSIIVVSDTLLYKYWGFRMDYTVLLYLKTPKEAAASVSILQMAAVFTGIIFLSAPFIILYRRFIDRLFEGFDRIRLWVPAILFFMILGGSLIIPIRGGVGVAPINAGTVYFSKDLFLNHSAINVVWNAGSSVINQKPTKNPYAFGDLESARIMTAMLTEDTGASVRLLNTVRPNIIFIVLESFGNALIAPLGGDSLTTPNLNRFIREGVVFTNFFASGNRTDKAVPAILNGYPAQPANSIMKEPEKTQGLPGIIKTFNGLGYSSSFWYGGEINFANFNSFVINSGFGQIVTMDNFSPELKYSSWGIPDHVLFGALMDSLRSVREPFIKVVLTLSSHEPFDVPMEPVFEGNDEMTRFRNSVYYSDKSLGTFLDKAKDTEWWEKTLIILVADHCRRNSNEVLVYDEEIFRIPMVWLGGALAVRNLKVEKTGSQVDIPLTILHQLDLEGNYPFGKDLLSEKSSSFAFYTFNEGFGFITDSSKYIYDHKLGNEVVAEGKNPEYAEKCGKAYLQVLYDDFLKR